MKNRSPLAVFFLSIITLGIYGIVWYVKTKEEMKALGADIPTAWLIIVPFVSIWWLWKYSKGVDLVTKGEYSTAVSFLLLWFLGFIGMAILQTGFNKVGASEAPAAAGTPPIAPQPPAPQQPVAGPPAPTV